MKVYLSPYISYIGMKEITQKVLWFTRNKNYNFLDDKSTEFPKWVNGLVSFLVYAKKPQKIHYPIGSTRSWKETLEDRDSEFSYLEKFCIWIHKKRERTLEVIIHDYDIWGADHTLSLVILPVLKKLKNEKQGCPGVDYDDTPYKAMPELEEHSDEHWEFTMKQWNFVLDEMIFAFEHIVDDNWRYKENVDDVTESSTFTQLENGYTQWNFKEHSEAQKVVDLKIKEIEKRVNNGLILFGKYFRALWD